MGLIKGITDAVLQKAKNEMKEYILKVMEEEDAEKVDQTDILPDDGENEEDNEDEDFDIEENEETFEEEEEVLPLVEENIVRLTFKKRPGDVSIPKEVVETLQFLSLNEFAVYLKLFIFCCDQKKNYGYLGNTLRKKTGLVEMEQEEFDKVVDKLSKYGLVQIEEVSDYQRTFVLYIPFDNEINTKVDTVEKHEKKQSLNRNRNKKQQKDHNGRKDKSQKTEKPTKDTPSEKQLTNELPGIAVEGNENEDLYKSYRTYVNLEIDKAKMRVGRSNFDKIYMEAVKYIDKNFGFKVLSDSDKFKEYLTSYYISAFDIKTFEEWKKDKP